jgi:uncharacterized membrane protein
LRQISTEMKNKYLKRFLSYILNGLVISLPVFGTGYIIVELLKWLDGIVPRLTKSKAELKMIEDAGGLDFSGWGIVILIGVLFLLGYLGSLFINDRLKDWFERIMDRIPGVNNVYHFINDILGAFVGNKKKFNQPVLVKVSEQLDMEMVGFITDTDLLELGDIKGKVAVYFPMSYSFAGHLIIVPIKNIKRIESNPVDVMKYTVSGGIVEFDPDDDKRSKR